MPRAEGERGAATFISFFLFKKTSFILSGKCSVIHSDAINHANVSRKRKGHLHVRQHYLLLYITPLGFVGNLKASQKYSLESAYFFFTDEQAAGIGGGKCAPESACHSY